DGAAGGGWGAVVVARRRGGRPLGSRSSAAQRRGLIGRAFGPRRRSPRRRPPRRRGSLAPPAAPFDCISRARPRNYGGNGGETDRDLWRLGGGRDRVRGVRAVSGGAVSGGGACGFGSTGSGRA